MEDQIFNLKLSKIKEYRNILAPWDNRRKIPMDFKECIARTFKELDDVVSGAETAIEALTEDPESPEYAAAVAAIWNTRENVTATRIPKAQAPLYLKPCEFRLLWFMFTDWN